MLSKYQMQPQVDIGLQGAAVLKDFKKHLEETGAKAETLEKVDRAIKYCEDCTEASQIIILALDWKSGLDKPAEKTEETAEEKPAKKEAPKKKKATKKKEEPAADDSLDDLF